MDTEDSNAPASGWKIMSIAFSSFLGVALLLIAIHIYTRRILMREENRRQRAAIDRLIRQLAATASESDGTGLARPVLSSIPSFPFKNTIYCKRGELIECSICLGSVGGDDVIRILPNCCHVFHVQCIDMWLVSHASCPICRTGAEPNVQPDIPRSSCAAVVDIHGEDGEKFTGGLDSVKRMDKNGPQTIVEGNGADLERQ